MKNIIGKHKQEVVEQMVRALAKIDGVEAIVLGGSYARGMARADSDVDIGIYYSEKSPPSLAALKELARGFDTGHDCVVTDFYEWGPWVNGGAWINTKVGEIDWLYRNIDQVNRVIEDAQHGRFSWDYRQQPPYGFFSVMYLADISHNIALYDPKGICDHLSRSVQEYPEALRKAIVQEHLWSVEFSMLSAKKFADRDCVYGTVGCMTRMAAELTQALFALNRVYFVTEKGAMETIDTFSLKPNGYAQRLNAILACPGSGQELIHSLKKLEDVIREVITLAYPLYQPKYSSL